MLSPLNSYLYGLILTDGNIYLTTRNRGRVSIELNSRDKELLEKLYNQIPNCALHERIRNTNYNSCSKTTILTNHQKQFRQFFIDHGIPTKNKSTNGSIPNTEYMVPDFWRGVYDGNGSIGYTQQNEPFISLATKSTPLANELFKLLREKFQITKNIKPNKRDHIYNIVLKNEDAIVFTNFIYHQATIYMQRKFNIYQTFQQWKRTKKHHIERSWSFEELTFIQTHTIEESIQHLNRTKSAIKTKLWRLNIQSNNN